MPQIPNLNLIPQEIKDKYQITDNAFSLRKIVNPELDTYKNEPKDEINIIVGDDKVPDNFIPQVKLERWSNEVNFSVRLVDTEVGQEKVSTLTDKIVYEKGNKKIEFYDYAEGEGGYKMVWYLNKKPKTSKVDFTFQAKGLNFYYQPPLTEEYQNGYSEEFQKEIVVTETQVKDLDGNVLVERPENVVGSYAVYHQTKGGMNDTYGKEYKVGKAFHIYRPHIIDANGAETWGILHIENGIYSVEIPQEFLDTAVYPIKSNDNFGYETLGSGYSNISGAYEQRIGNFYTVGIAGTLSTIKAYLQCVGNLAFDAKVFVNQKNSGGSGIHAQIATKENIDIPGAAGWKEFTLANEAIAAATDYILNVFANSENSARIVYIFFDTIEWNGSNVTEYMETYENGAYGTPESPWVVDLYNPNQEAYPDWEIAIDYVGEDVVVNNFGVYECIAAHTSTADDEPGVGANWEDYWEFSYTLSFLKLSIYATYTPAGGATNTSINIGDTFKTVESAQINIADSWKAVSSIQVNVGDSWRTVF